ncbi:hypothetical protein FOCC_FOCC012391 [Frankliniella occidentalis]|nr:hypothetical protein FOCC_FOCC012391 [Frankliniella occidentalis]
MEGSISDRQLFLKSGVMEFLTPGDAVMCDRGFDIEADLNEIEVDFICPPFLANRDAFTPREILIAKSIATSRIHVETLIGRIKFFKLVRGVLPNTMLDVASDVFRVAANLVNLSPPFIVWHTSKKDKGNA